MEKHAEEAPAGEAPRGHKAGTILPRIILPAVSIVVLMLWIMGAFRRDVIRAGEHAPRSRPAAGSPAEAVSEREVWVETEAAGTVRAERMAAINARVVANVVETRVAAGQKVKKGEVLALLDDRELRRREEQAQEALKAAEATLAQARADFERDRKLFAGQVIPAHDFELTQTNTRIAETTVRRLTQLVREAEVALSYAEIHSPFNGVVADRLVNAGDQAAPGKPLFTMYEQDRLWLEASVPEEMMRYVRLGQTMRYRIDAEGRDRQGRVVEIVPSADAASHAVAVRARIEGTAGLYPGMYGRLMIRAGKERLLMVPAAAVRRVGQLAAVDVVRDGTVERRSVQLGRKLDGGFEVYSGLRAGEMVAVTAGGGGPSSR